MAIIFILLSVCMLTYSAFSGDCRTAIDQFQNDGHLIVKISDGNAFAAIEPIIWKNAAYKTKLGIAGCIKQVYQVHKVYLVSMERTDNIIATYDGVKFKIY